MYAEVVKAFYRSNAFTMDIDSWTKQTPNPVVVVKRWADGVGADVIKGLRDFNLTVCYPEKCSTEMHAVGLISTGYRSVPNATFTILGRSDA